MPFVQVFCLELGSGPNPPGSGSKLAQASARIVLGAGSSIVLLDDSF